MSRLPRRALDCAHDALIGDNPKPTREQIVEHMSTNICRCGIILFGGAVTAWPLVGHAQQGERMRRIWCAAARNRR
jgi:hypothetical protein